MPRLISGLLGWPLGGALVAAMMAGCNRPGTDLNLVPVNGRITYNGQTIIEGLVRFVPVGDTRGPTSAAPIVQSEYRLDARGGVPAGEHRVEIEAYRRDAIGNVPPEADVIRDARPNYLPPQYGPGRSTLRVTIPNDVSEFTYNVDLPRVH